MVGGEVRHGVFVCVKLAVMVLGGCDCGGDEDVGGHCGVKGRFGGDCVGLRHGAGATEVTHACGTGMGGWHVRGLELQGHAGTL